MTSEIFISFFIAISLIQISVAEDPPSSSTPANEAQSTSNTPTRPPPILPVVKDNVWFYGGWFGNYLKSFVAGDEWSLKYILYKLIEGTHYVGSTIVDASDFLLNSPYITINSGSTSPSDTSGAKEEPKKSEATK